MGVFDNRSDTEKEIDKFYKNSKKQSDSYNNNTYSINQSTENNSANNQKQSSFKTEFGTVNTEKKEIDNQHDKNIEYKYQEQYSKVYKEISEKKSKETKIGIIVSIVMIILFAVIIFFINSFSGDFDPNIMVFFTLSVFAVIGFSIAFIPRMKTKKNKERCKQLVKAKIIDVKKEYDGKVKTEYGSRSRYRYISTYRYFYSGEEYVVVTDTYQGLLIPKVGDEIDMLVNENDPKDYYIEQKDADLLALVFGLVFAIAPTLLVGLNLLLLKV